MGSHDMYGVRVLLRAPLLHGASPWAELTVWLPKARPNFVSIYISLTKTSVFSFPRIWLWQTFTLDCPRMLAVHSDLILKERLCAGLSSVRVDVPPSTPVVQLRVIGGSSEMRTDVLPAVPYVTPHVYW
jgi:hypothetical protein